MAEDKTTWTPTVLGETVQYQTTYNPTLLQAIPRLLNRQSLKLTPDALPFFGQDVWDLYELSWLTANGKPMNAMAELSISSDSLYLVESKSLKLYLNTFHQTIFESESVLVQTMQDDLSQLVQGTVNIILHAKKLEKLGYLLGDCLDDLPVIMDQYALNPSVLKNSTQCDQLVTESLVTHLFKSNCLVTGQPDWASIKMKYTGAQWNRSSILKYLLSYRMHQEFHEHCVERIFMDLLHYCSPDELTVIACFTRRGGISITPIRSSKPIDYKPSRLWRQ
ncbi:MAG: NADPH-dependent 7-cyano-7-deazaguanine reductase QueF [Endozoicomonadaceae bacterium]|nr:NADPH-dependent 7-cyano-7-deazaguanine reductase QueF [Endozoicomonadaceae bacterium]MBE8232252.1 NADPH-dependent 7-cyano-7-deazaguanine reductase QueF [Endozoicomonadaceae bacterium]